MKVFFVFFFLIIFDCTILIGQTLIKFDHFLKGIDKKIIIDKENNLTFEFGNLLIAYANEKSVLDTLKSTKQIGLDDKGNRYFFSLNPTNNSGIIMTLDNLKLKVYCNKNDIVVIDMINNYVLKVYTKNCGFDVVSFTDCGYYNFSYSLKTKELNFVEKRLIWGDRKRTIKLNLLNDQ
jgi:hypothetical protein